MTIYQNCVDFFFYSENPNSQPYNIDIDVFGQNVSVALCNVKGILLNVGENINKCSLPLVSYS